MTDQRPPFDGDDDLGEPIAELASLREEPGDRFLARIRSRIFDRMFAGQVLDFTLPVVFRMLLEYVGMIFSLFATQTPKNEEKNP